MPGDSETSGMSGPIDAGVERAEHPTTAGALLRALGTDLERDGGTRSEIDSETVAVEPPEEVRVETEMTTADGETELEVELAWDDETGDGVRVGETVPESDETGAADDAERATDRGAAASRGLDTAVSRATFESFQDRAGGWRWRLRHDNGNGNGIADSGEGDASRAGARNDVESVIHDAPGASVEREG